MRVVGLAPALRILVEKRIMIAKYDIAKLKHWLKLAQKQGTDKIKIVVGNKPDTWIVSVLDGKEANNERGRN